MHNNRGYNLLSQIYCYQLLYSHNLFVMSATNWKHKNYWLKMLLSQNLHHLYQYLLNKLVNKLFLLYLLFDHGYCHILHCNWNTSKKLHRPLMSYFYRLKDYFLANRVLFFHSYIILYLKMLI